MFGRRVYPLPLAGRGRGWGLSPRQNRDEQSFACLDPAKGGTPAMTANKKGGRKGRPFLIGYLSRSLAGGLHGIRRISLGVRLLLGFEVFAGGLVDGFH
jgi:hypothetical protein